MVFQAPRGSYCSSKVLSENLGKSTKGNLSIFGLPATVRVLLKLDGIVQKETGYHESRGLERRFSTSRCFTGSFLRFKGMYCVLGMLLLFARDTSEVIEIFGTEVSPSFEHLKHLMRCSSK